MVDLGAAIEGAGAIGTAADGAVGAAAVVDTPGESEEARRAGRRAQGLKITFSHPQVGKPQTLYYLSLDATDKALKANPEFLPFLAQFGSSVTFLKSASYLLHGNEFAGTRAALLDATELLVQDDTGIPYRYLRARGFEVSLFDRYARPIKDFNYGYQHDLAAAYRTSGKVADLPFPFGYQAGRPLRPDPRARGREALVTRARRLAATMGRLKEASGTRGSSGPGRDPANRAGGRCARSSLC